MFLPSSFFVSFYCLTFSVSSVKDTIVVSVFAFQNPDIKNEMLAAVEEVRKTD